MKSKKAIKSMIRDFEEIIMRQEHLQGKIKGYADDGTSQRYIDETKRMIVLLNEVLSDDPYLTLYEEEQYNKFKK